MSRRNLERDPNRIRSHILSDTGRLSELEKYNIFNYTRLESLDLTCQMVQLAFAANYCALVLVDHVQAHIMGAAGLAPSNEEPVREHAVALVCDNAPASCGQANIQTVKPASPSKHQTTRPETISVIPLASGNGHQLGALCISRGNGTLSATDLCLAERFADSCLQQLDSHRLQLSFAQRAEISRRQADKLKAQKQSLARNDRMFGKVSRMARIGGWEFNISTREIFWSGDINGIVESGCGTGPTMKELFRQLERTGRRQLNQRISQCINDGMPFEMEIPVTTFAGADKWLRIAGETDRIHSAILTGTVQDVTGQKEKEAAIEHVGTHDELTGLANRKLFNSKLDHAVSHALQTRSLMGLILIDADYFKFVNDTYGHNAGDTVLREVAARIRSCVRSDDTVARLGGDEFAVIVPEIGDPGILAKISDRLQIRLANGIDHDGGNSVVTASIGIAVCPSDSENSQKLLINADLALYNSKEMGRACHSFFSSELEKNVNSRQQIIRNISTAIDNGELVPYYQPIVCTRDMQVSGMEALVRWQTSDGRILAPGAFQHALDDPVLSARIGDVVVTSVINQIKFWSANEVPFRTIAINLSGAQLQYEAFAESLLIRLSLTGVEPSSLSVEVTEGVFLARGGTTVKDNLERLSDAGISIALDDFGTGYASLTHLKDFPVDRIKIDKSFVAQIPHDKECLGIVKAIIGLGQNLNKKTVAEGVETEQQARTLRDLGCDFLQGHLYSKPVCASMIPQKLIDIEQRGRSPLRVVGE